MMRIFFFFLNQSLTIFCCVVQRAIIEVYLVPLGSRFVRWPCICLCSFVDFCLQEIPRESQASYVLVFVFVFLFVFVFVYVFFVWGRTLSECPNSPGSPRLRMASSPNQTICHWTLDIKHHWTQDTKKDTILKQFRLDVKPNTVESII